MQLQEQLAIGNEIELCLIEAHELLLEEREATNALYKKRIDALEREVNECHSLLEKRTSSEFHIEDPPWWKSIRNLEVEDQFLRIRERFVNDLQLHLYKHITSGCVKNYSILLKCKAILEVIDTTFLSQELPGELTHEMDLKLIESVSDVYELAVHVSKIGAQVSSGVVVLKECEELLDDLFCFKEGKNLSELVLRARTIAKTMDVGLKESLSVLYFELRRNFSAIAGKILGARREASAHRKLFPNALYALNHIKNILEPVFKDMGEKFQNQNEETSQALLLTTKLHDEASEVINHNVFNSTLFVLFEKYAESIHRLLASSGISQECECKPIPTSASRPQRNLSKIERGLMEEIDSLRAENSLLRKRKQKKEVVQPARLPHVIPYQPLPKETILQNWDPIMSRTKPPPRRDVIDISQKLASSLRLAAAEIHIESPFGLDPVGVRKLTEDSWNHIKMFLAGYN